MWSHRVSGDIPTGRPGSCHGSQGLPLLPHGQESELQLGSTPGQQSSQGLRGRASTWTFPGPSFSPSLTLSAPSLCHCLSVSISHSVHSSSSLSISHTLFLSLCLPVSISNSVSVSLPPFHPLYGSRERHLLCSHLSSSQPEGSSLFAPASLLCPAGLSDCRSTPKRDLLHQWAWSSGKSYPFFFF